MRLKISLNKENFALPLAYNSILQGVIYNMFDRNSLGDFYHNEGYQTEDKKYKLFTFSNLFGRYEIKNKQILFKDDFCFYLSAIDQEFIRGAYEFLTNNSFLFINRQKVKIKDISIINTPHIEKVDEVWLKTIAPVTVYKTYDGKTHYYEPFNTEFNELIVNNLRHKMESYQYPLNDFIFEVLEMKNIKRRMVRFKNCYYLAYHVSIKIKVSREVFDFIYNTGLSSKNSCGFGMIDMDYEANNLSL